MKAEKPEKRVDKKKKKTTQADVSVELYCFINRLQCERHKTGVEGKTKKRCGWPEPRKPAEKPIEPPKEKLVLPKDQASHVTREDARKIVSSSVFDYLVEAGSFSAESLEEVLQLFFTHSSLTNEQLGWQFQRANSRSLKGFLNILESGVYPEDCLFLGKQKKADEPTKQQKALKDAKQALDAALEKYEKNNQAVSDAAETEVTESEVSTVAAAVLIAPSGVSSCASPAAHVAHTSSAVRSSAASASSGSSVTSSTRETADQVTDSGTVYGAASSAPSPSVTRAATPASSKNPTGSSSASPSVSKRAASVPSKTGSDKNSTPGSKPPASASSAPRSQSASASSGSGYSSPFSGSMSASSDSPSISSGKSVPRPPSQSLKRKQPDDLPDLLALENRARKYLETYRVGEYPELREQIGALELYVDTVAGYRTFVDDKSDAMTKAIANEGEERFRVFVQNLSRIGPRTTGGVDDRPNLPAFNNVNQWNVPMTPPNHHGQYVNHPSNVNGFRYPPPPPPIPYMQQYQYAPPQAAAPSPPVNYATPPHAAPPQTKQARRF